MNTIYYRPIGESETTWNVLQTLENNILLSNLPFDTKYEWRVESNSLDDLNYSDIAVFSTELIEDNIEVSDELYGKLVDWSKDEQIPTKLHDYLNSLNNISIYEKLSFYQSYEYGGKPFRRVISSDNNSDDVRSWVNPGTDNFAGDCNCKVITNGSLTSAPIDYFDENEGIIMPKIEYWKKNTPKTTYFDYISKGASKFVALKQYERDGGSSYEHSNLKKGDLINSSPQYSKINFFLLCEDYTKVSSKCGCCRTLNVKYNYASKVQASSDTRWCPWSKGSYAKAEDGAMVVAYYNSDLGKSKVLGVGQNMVTATCQKNWNPTFFVNYVDFVFPIIKTLAAKDAKIEDLLKIADQLQDAIKKLIVTPTHRDTGKCNATIVDTKDLLDGNENIELCPNSPVEIAMFSFHHVLVGGYGCWHPKAAVASDMYLAGVVESRNVPDDPYCCTKKSGVYIVGSSPNTKNKPGLGKGVVNLDPPHSTEDRLRDVAFFINQFGKWDNINYGLSSNLPLLTKEFFAKLTGPSCKPNVGGGISPRTKDSFKSISVLNKLERYQVHFNGFKDKEIKLNLYSVSGAQVIKERNITINEDFELFEINNLHLPKGIYILSVNSENYEFHDKLIIN